jgi:prepilin-type N-terminal cleavage/methylation domain-containing protein
MRRSVSNRNSPISTARGFSLIELVIVVVIIGIIAAIAIPRLSRGSAGAADSALSGNLAVLRNAIDLYATEHGGTFPKALQFSGQLTQYTDSSGAAGPKGGTFIFGPYLRKVPTLPVGPANYKGSATVVDGKVTPVVGTAPGAWWYNEDTGEIKANLLDTEKDAAGTSYNAY